MENKTCLSCKNCVDGVCTSAEELCAGRELLLEKLHENSGLNYSFIDNFNIYTYTTAFKLVLRRLNIPFDIGNKITTTLGDEFWENQDKWESVLTESEYKKLEPFWKYTDSVEYLVKNKVISNFSVHASGCILMHEPFAEMTLPVHHETHSLEYNGHYAEEIGLLKFDLLSLSVLSFLRMTEGVNIDWESPISDPKVFDFIKNENLNLVFQFGSPVVDNLLKSVPREILDINTIAEISALNRPGPLDNGFDKIWMDINQGKRLDGDMKTISDILNDHDTSKRDRILIYQEDIMKVFLDLGFTLAEADDIRKALGKKKKDILQGYMDEFLVRWQKKYHFDGSNIWNIISEYSKYCFNKSHAISYAYVTAKNAEILVYHYEEFISYLWEMSRHQILPLVEDIKYPSIKEPWYEIKIRDKYYKVNELSEHSYEHLSDAFYSEDFAKLLRNGAFDNELPSIDGWERARKILPSSFNPEVFPKRDSFEEILSDVCMFSGCSYAKTGFKDFVVHPKRGKDFEIKNEVDGISYRFREFPIPKIPTVATIGEYQFYMDKIDQGNAFVDTKENKKVAAQSFDYAMKKKWPVPVKFKCAVKSCKKKYGRFYVQVVFNGGVKEIYLNSPVDKNTIVTITLYYHVWYNKFYPEWAVIEGDN